MHQLNTCLIEVILIRDGEKPNNISGAKSWDLCAIAKVLDRSAQIRRSSSVALQFHTNVHDFVWRTAIYINYPVSSYDCVLEY